MSESATLPIPSFCADNLYTHVCFEEFQSPKIIYEKQIFVGSISVRVECGRHFKNPLLRV